MLLSVLHLTISGFVYFLTISLMLPRSSSSVDIINGASPGSPPVFMNSLIFFGDGEKCLMRTKRSEDGASVG